MADEWAKSFYASARWKKLRLALIRERGMRCERCGRTFLLESDIEAHHVEELTPQNISDPYVTLNPDNILLLCKDCHNAEHERYKGKQSKRVTIIYGAPCSGKEAYVRARIKRGDIVLEFDHLYQALTWRELHDKPSNVKDVVFRARDNIIESIKMRAGGWHHAYIIGTYPFRAQRESLAKHLNAELVFVRRGEDECLLKAEELGPLGAGMKKYIRRWFEEFEP